MTFSTTQQQGQELNQLSRLLFNRASRLWLSSLGFEFLGGLFGIGVGLGISSPDLKLIFAFVVLGILVCAYVIRIIFEFTYNDAEMMRRQSVLAESLDWPIGATQFSEWRRRAGERILKNFKIKPRDPDYYTTQTPTGPRRLLEMTIESSFFTRHVYCKIKTWFWIFFSVIVAGSILVFAITPLEMIQLQTRIQLIYILYLLLPLVISIDLFGWAVRLMRLSSSIEQIEQDLERLEKEVEPNVQQVLRLISEYNCQVICGFPVPNFLFQYWHNSINELWTCREKIGWDK